MTNFKEQYLNNEVTIKDLDTHVEMWHKKKPNISLQDYLGFNDDEYTAFAHSEFELKQKLDTVKKTSIKKYEETGSFIQKIKSKYTSK